MNCLAGKQAISVKNTTLITVHGCFEVGFPTTVFYLFFSPEVVLQPDNT